MLRAAALRARWAAGKPVVMSWGAIPSPFAQEALVSAGYDAGVVDAQHGVVGMADTLACVAAIDGAARRPALVRVPWNDPAWIMKALDGGASGIICPMINTAAEAEQFIAACRYAPDGNRSWGPHRGVIAHGGAGAYFEAATSGDGAPLTIAMIETAEAMQNLTSILAVRGLDAIYVGPNDLSISLVGRPFAGVGADAVVDEALGEIFGAAAAAGVQPGVHCGSGAMARAMRDRGATLMAIGGDWQLLREAAQRELAASGLLNNQQD